MANRLIENVIRDLNFIFPEFQPEPSHGDPFRVQNDFNILSKIPKLHKVAPKHTHTHTYIYIYIYIYYIYT